VAGADGNGKRIDASAVHEVLRLVGVGEQKVMATLAFGSHTVLLTRLAGFQRAQASQFAFDRHSYRVRELADLA